jgi:regulatory protein
MRITAIEPQVNRSEQVNLFVDGRLLMSIGVLVVERLGLRVGQELTLEQLAGLRREAALQEALDRALNYLSFRPRSREEVRRHLQRRGTPADLIAEVLERLQELKLVDDRAFASFWVEERDRFSPRGARALRSELRARGVAPEIAAEAIGEERAAEREEQSEEARALRAGHRKAQTLLRSPTIDYATFRNRLGPFLVRRGFSYETARHAVQALWQELRASPPEDEPPEE